MPAGAIGYTTDYRMASSSRDGLSTTGDGVEPVRALDQRSRRLFGRSLKLRSVVAGSCTGREPELVALGNAQRMPYYHCERARGPSRCA